MQLSDITLKVKRSFRNGSVSLLVVCNLIKRKLKSKKESHFNLFSTMANFERLSGFFLSGGDSQNFMLALPHTRGRVQNSVAKL